MGVSIESKFLKSYLLGTSTPLPIKKSLESCVLIQSDKIIINDNIELEDDLVFHKGEIYDKEIIFDGGSFKNITFEGGTFKKLLFRRGNFNGYVSIRGGTIGSLVLLGGNFNHWLGTLDGINNPKNSEEKLAEEPLIINRFELEGGSYHHGLWISGGRIDRFEIKAISDIILHCMPNDDKTFNESKQQYEKRHYSVPQIKDLIISRYCNKNSYYHFSEFKAERLQFLNFSNLGNITISQVELSKTLTCENSDLGKTTFINCDFSTNKMIFDSSKINEIGLAGTKFPNAELISISSEKNKDQKKEVLSQLKKVYQNLGDIVTAKDYQSEELNTHFSSPKLPFVEWLTLGLNKYSNNHGQRMGQALVLLLISTSIFYVLYCRSLGFVCSTLPGSYDMFLKNASYYIEFISPFRKSNFIPEALLGKDAINKVPSLAIFIDSLSKIINAYLLYQFIAAFRKFGKST